MPAPTPPLQLEIIRRRPPREPRSAPLLLVHGVCHAAWCWEHWSDWLSERGWDAHALSLRGHGQSDGRDRLDDFGLADYCNDVVTVARTMDRPVLIAHSMGAAVALLAVADAPSLFRGLVLLAPTPPDGLRRAEVLPLLFQPRGMFRIVKLLGGQRLTAAEVQSLPFFDGRITIEEAGRHAERLQAESKMAGNEARVFRAPPLAKSLPTLVMGSLRDRLLPRSALERSARQLEAELIVLDEGCHDLMLDPTWPKSVAMLAGWLERLGL